MTADRREFFLIRWWYNKSPLLYLLLPLSLLYWLITSIRRWFYQAHIFKSHKAAVPLIVVGNITTGGTGKTPLVIALVKALQKAGYKPGIISRGYGGRAPQYPFEVTADSDPLEAGDEPILMAKRCTIPVVIDPVRKNAADYLLAGFDCNIIISDDGLQHYALQRDIEIAVVDGARGFGNNLVLPAGPLRETVSRLETVNFVISNGDNQSINTTAASSGPLYHMHLQASVLCRLTQGESIVTTDWPYSKQVHALAGIGNPQRFFASLQQLGFNTIDHSFPDHHQYDAADLQFDDDLPLIMTEKDAVKVACIKPDNNCWFLPVEAIIDDDFYSALLAQLKALPTAQAEHMKG